MHARSRHPTSTIEHVDVTTITLDDLIRDCNIAMENLGLVVLDVEGSELFALRGFHRQRLGRPVPMMIEYSEKLLTENGTRLELEALCVSTYSRIADLRSADPALVPVDQDFFDGLHTKSTNRLTDLLLV